MAWFSVYCLCPFYYLNIGFLTLHVHHDEFMGRFLGAYVGVDTGIIHESPSNDTSVVIVSFNCFSLLVDTFFLILVDTVLPFPFLFFILTTR